MLTWILGKLEQTTREIRKPRPLSNKIISTYNWENVTGHGKMSHFSKNMISLLINCIMYKRAHLEDKTDISRSPLFILFPDRAFFISQNLKHMVLIKTSSKFPIHYICHNSTPEDRVTGYLICSTNQTHRLWTC